MNLLKQNHVRWALWMCLVLIGCLSYMEITGLNTSFDAKGPSGLVLMFIGPILIWFLGIRAKKVQQGGRITFKEGLQEAFRISLAYAIISPFIFLAYYVFINPEILDYVRSAYNLEGVSTAIIIVADMVAQFLSAIVFGTAIGAVIAFILRTRTVR